MNGSISAVAWGAAAGALALWVSAAGASAQGTRLKKVPAGTIKSGVKVTGKGTKKAGGKLVDIGKVGPNDRMEAPKFLTNRALLNAPDVDAWFAALPNWTDQNRPRPDSEKTSDAGSGTESQGGRSYTVTRTKYSIRDTPEEIVTFQPVNGFWLGGLVQEKGLQLGLGSMQEIGVESGKRASFKVSSDLPMSGNYRSVSAPSGTKVSSAIGGLLQSGSRVDWGGARTLDIVENYSEDQTAHELGLNARYMTASLKSSFKADRFNSKHTITAAFIERACTIQADFEGRTRRRAFFNDGFTVEDARSLVNQERVTTTNLPAYIKSITYGRVVIFTLTSTLSESEMRAAVSAAVNGATWNVNASYQGSQKSKSTSFELRVTSLGSGQKTFSKLVPATGIANVLQVMNSYLREPAPLTTMVPISYTANTMRDDQLAALSKTTEYTVTKYVPNPIGERYKIKMWITVRKSDDGVADNTFECYGTLRVNGDVWWQIDRSEASAYKREKGQTLEISEDRAHAKKEFTFDYFYDTRPQFKMSLVVRDSDGGSKDETFGSFSPSLDLRSIAGQTKTWDWDSKDGEASRLHMRIERTDYL